jgi:hypothetical protein
LSSSVAEAKRAVVQAYRIMARRNDRKLAERRMGGDLGEQSHLCWTPEFDL